jgi:hypothetical protein
MSYLSSCLLLLHLFLLFSFSNARFDPVELDTAAELPPPNPIKDIFPKYGEEKAPIDDQIIDDTEVYKDPEPVVEETEGVGGTTKAQGRT